MPRAALASADNFTEELGYFCPGEELGSNPREWDVRAYRRWLWERTPGGAATICVHEYELMGGSMRIVVPIVRDPIERAPPKGPGRRSRRDDPALRLIAQEVAWRHSMGFESIELADRFAFEKQQHLRSAGGPQTRRYGGEGASHSKTAERYLRDGRRLMHNAGAYPWAVVADGELPDDWPSDDDIALNLGRWHMNAARKPGYRLKRALRLGSRQLDRSLAE